MLNPACLACSLSMYCVCRLVNTKLDCSAFKVLRKIGCENLFQVSRKNSDQLNENLSQETIFLATVPLKGTLTVSQSSILKTRFSILDSQKL